MLITQEADNAFRIVLCLAELPHGGKRTARSIAENKCISVQFTLKTLNKLVKSKIARAFRGVNGGYVLNKPADEISLLEVLEAVDGPIAINKCLKDTEYCSIGDVDACNVRFELERIQSSLRQELGNIMIGSLV